MESIASSKKPYSAVKVIWFDVVLPQVFCKFACFLSGNIRCLRVVVDRSVVVRTILVNVTVVGDCDVFGNINVNNTNALFCSCFDVGLCGIKLDSKSMSFNSRT